MTVRYARLRSMECFTRGDSWVRPSAWTVSSLILIENFNLGGQEAGFRSR